MADQKLDGPAKTTAGGGDPTPAGRRGRKCDRGDLPGRRRVQAARPRAGDDRAAAAPEPLTGTGMTKVDKKEDDQTMAEQEEQAEWNVAD